LSSVQACANLGEEAPLEAVRSQRIELPLIEVDFEELSPSLRKPLERIAWASANTWNATPIYRLAPHALVFGLWGSPKKPGGLAGSDWRGCDPITDRL
jgi:hypothetical protein